MFQELESLSNLIKTLNDMGFDNGSITIIFLVVGCFLALFNFGKFKFKEIEKRLEPLEKLNRRVHKLELCITEIQSFLVSKFKFSFNHIADNYGEAFSPIRLKQEFHKYIIAGNINTQLENPETLGKLVDWLAEKNPETGLDAQNYITELVLSGKIKDYLQVKDYRQNIYESGLTETAADAILTLYLFEELIPEVLND